MRKIFAIGLLLCLFVLICGCTSATDPIVGNWSLSFMGQNTITDFHADKTVTSYTNGIEGNSGTWSKSSGQVYIVTTLNKSTGLHDSSKIDLSSDGKTFSFEIAPMFVFTKQ